MINTRKELKKAFVFRKTIHVLFIILITVLLTVVQTGVRIYAEETEADDPVDEVLQETALPSEEHSGENASDETGADEEEQKESEAEDEQLTEEESEDDTDTPVITLTDEEPSEEDTAEASGEAEETEDDGRFIDGDFGPVDTQHAPYIPEYGTYPDATGEADFNCVEDMYGRVDQSDAVKITSLFSDDAFRQLEEGIERILTFEPAGNEEVASVLTKTRAFVKAGGLKGDSGALQSGDFSASSSAIGLLSALPAAEEGRTGRMISTDTVKAEAMASAFWNSLYETYPCFSGMKSYE